MISQHPTEEGRIAVVMTCHNRCTSTLHCLQNIFDQDLPPTYRISVFMVDDGSSDGTSDAVRQNFPTVAIIPGNGTLFWNGGMRVAFGAAMEDDFDFYLWLNDDTNLYPNAIATLLTVWRERPPSENECIVVGSTRDPDTGSLTYGGVVHTSRWHPLKLRKTPPKEVPIPCDTFGGNCVLIPRLVAGKLGNLDPSFTHLMGDTDYGLRARDRNIQIWVAPNYQGTCTANPVGDYVTDSTMTIRERFRRIVSPKGIPPREWWVLIRRHGGHLWFILLFLPYIRLLITAVGADVRSLVPRLAPRHR